MAKIADNKFRAAWDGARLQAEFGLESHPAAYGDFVQALALHCIELEKQIKILEGIERHRQMMVSHRNIFGK